MEVKERERERRQRLKARKRKQRRKNFLIFLVIIILALATFVITVKVTNPDFDFSTLIPYRQLDRAVVFVREDILGKTTAATTTGPTTTRPTTTVRQLNSADYDYIEFEDFKFDTSLQGNQLGNLLNKSQGAVTYSSTYIYYSIAGKGIYRFEPSSETNAKVQVNKYNFKYLNVLGDYLYAVDTDSHKLKKMQVYGGDMVNVSDNIDFAYLYKDKIYFVGTDNTVGYIKTKDMSKKVLFTGQADKKISFAGISLSRLFFVQTDEVAGYSEYITVSLKDKSDKGYFRPDSKGDSIINLHMEVGFMYYYEKQSDGSYNLIRQKFGSDKTVTLLEKCNLSDYPVVYYNRLYYTDLDSGKLRARELNMNSDDKKTMLAVTGADGTGSLAVGYGYQYVFLIGTKNSNGDNTCKCSCIYTSSSKKNTLTFKDGALKY